MRQLQESSRLTTWRAPSCIRRQANTAWRAERSRRCSCFNAKQRHNGSSLHTAEGVQDGTWNAHARRACGARVWPLPETPHPWVWIRRSHRVTLFLVAILIVLVGYITFQPHRHQASSNATAHTPIIQITGAHPSLRIDGCGAFFVITTPQAGVFSIAASQKLSVSNISIDYDPLPMTQGHVSRALHGNRLAFSSALMGMHPVGFPFAAISGVAGSASSFSFWLDHILLTCA